jgi:hypothetical protein
LEIEIGREGEVMTKWIPKSALEEADDPVPNGHDDAAWGVSLADFYGYMPGHSYIFTATGETWPASSVNSRIPPIVVASGSEPKKMSAAAWLDRNRAVEQMTWAPGEPQVINDRLISHGGWIDRPGARCFNLYRPPMIRPGAVALADPWIEHLRRIYPEEADHIIKCLAHRVQRPQEKINHALVLGGAPGIGKDTMLEPVKRAVGPWNFQEISPQHLLGRFNGFAKSVVLRISEARDLGDLNRFQFYDHIKAYAAAPPDVLRVDEKHLREHSVLNCCGIIITTNYKTDGIYLPEDDRRHFVAWSDRRKEEFPDGYWRERWRWYEHGGFEHVAAYLAAVDLSDFDPKEPPPKTAAFWQIVNASRPPEDAELNDAIDRLGRPDIVTVAQVAEHSTTEFKEWLEDRRNSRRMPHRFEECGYIAVRNEAAKDGLWKIRGKRQVIYGKTDLPIRDRVAAAMTATGAR